MLDMRPESLDKIYFSDQSRIVLGSDKQWVWYRRGEEIPSASIATHKFPPSRMIFAVIGPGYKSKLLLVDDSIDSDKYIDNLAALGFIEDLDRMHGPLLWIFQQDGAACHTSAKSLEWLEEKCDLVVDWPSKSPNLSPIQLLWAILKRIVNKFAPQTIEELKTALLESWELIGQRTIDKLCASFRNRLVCCQEEQGASISKHLFRLGEGDAMKDFVERNAIRLPWTEEEDRLILELRTRFGTQ
jgi:hypothetical protein